MATTNFTINGVEIGTYHDFMDKEYLIENYPEINNAFKQAGLWMWGRNTEGQLGDNTTTNKSSPVQTVAGGFNWKQVSGGGYHTAAIKADGTLWLWGDNTYGQLGDNSSAPKSSPVQTVSGGTDWKQVSIGTYHTSAIKTDGTLWSWGYGEDGNLGNNSITSRSSPVQTVAGGSNWYQVSCRWYSTAAIKIDGTLWLWGANTSGNLGNNSTTSRSSPVQTVSGGTDWKQVATSEFTAAIKADGSLWLWGRNDFGQLGDNNTSSKSSPVQTVAGGTNWKQVTIGGSHNTAAIKTDGTLWTWGANTYGELGDNSTSSKSSPVQTVAGGTTWKQVSAGAFQFAAIKTDGTLWLWGRNSLGQLASSSIDHKSSPVQTVAGGTNWKQVSGGLDHISAIRDDSQDQI